MKILESLFRNTFWELISTFIYILMFKNNNYRKTEGNTRVVSRNGYENLTIIFRNGYIHPF